MVFTQSQKEIIEERIQSVEKRTGAEVMVLVVPECDAYTASSVLAATIFSLPLSILLTPAVGGYLWLSQQNMWVFLSLFTLFFGPIYYLIHNIRSIKRCFIFAREMEKKVQDEAMVQFFSEGVSQTRAATGVLIFISMFERQVVVLGDRGINRLLQPSVWQQVVDIITSGIRGGRAAEAICEGIDRVGKMLTAHIPVPPGDTDELKNLIVKKV
jgi:putative membrane protein